MISAGPSTSTRNCTHIAKPAYRPIMVCVTTLLRQCPGSVRPINSWGMTMAPDPIRAELRRSHKGYILPSHGELPARMDDWRCRHAESGGHSVSREPKIRRRKGASVLKPERWTTRQ